MKKARFIITASMVALMGLSAFTFSSCTKDDQECAVGLEGKNCDQQVRTKYYNTYRGNGTDNQGNTYTNWAMDFSQEGTDATKMRMRLLDDADDPVISAVVTLQTNTTFTVNQFTNNQGLTYSGNGSIDENTASLTLREEGSGDIVTYTFSNMNR